MVLDRESWKTTSGKHHQIEMQNAADGSCQLLYSISLMAAIFAITCGLAKQIDENTSIARKLILIIVIESDTYLTMTTDASGAAAAAMLFLYMGAFTVGFQATVWVYP